MNINIAKNIVYKNIGIKRKFFYKGPRNQNEIFEGFIDKAYPAIFTISTCDGITLSFTYSDLLINNLKIVD